MPTLSLGLCFHLFHFGGCLPYALCLVKIIIPLEPFDSCHGVKRSPFWRADWPKTFSTIRLARNIGGWRWILGSRCFIFLRVVTAAYALDGTLGRFNPDFFSQGRNSHFLGCDSHVCWLSPSFFWVECRFFSPKAILCRLNPKFSG
jgi:hypothetical protein